jgi:hypothetical protein
MNLIRRVSLLGLALLGWGWSSGTAWGQPEGPDVVGQAEAAVSKVAGPKSKALTPIRLTASDGAADDWLGTSVSLSSDGNTAIVGAANNATAAGEYAGSAYVFVRSGSSWTQQAKLTASDGADGDWFGWSVWLSGDGNTALVGAFNKTVGTNAYQGSAYVFARSGSSWSQQAKLLASNGAAGDYFGRSASLSGDGHTTLVGAIGANASQGSAYMFVLSGTNWTEQARLTASDGAADDYFGYSVSLSGDGNTALVGTYNDETAAGLSAGSAYMFVRSGSSWTEQAKLTASDGAAYDSFGLSVSLSSDGNSALVGANNNGTSAGVRAGSAYFFSRNGSSWSQQAKLTASDGAADDCFGWSVSLSGDGNRALVGAVFDDTAAGADAGSAYVFVPACELSVSASPSNGGTVSSGGTFVPGSVATVIATPASLFAFANWTENGTVVSHDISYTFTLDRDRDLVANFAAGSYVPVKGTYTGLFYESGAVAQRSSGGFTINTTTRSALSGSLQIGGVRYSISGKLDNSGGFTQAVKRGGALVFTVQLQVNLWDTDRIAGTVTAADGSWTASLEGDRAVFNRAANLAAQAGAYTIVIPGSPGGSSEPGGYGYGTVKVDTAGKLKLAGSLADGTKISQSATLSKNGQWPLYVPLYRNRGALLGWISIAGPPNDDLGGILSWIKPPVPLAKYYPDGFALEVPVMGSRYSAPARGIPVLNFSEAAVVLSSAGLADVLVNYVKLDSNNRVTSANKVSVVFTLSTGAFRGSVPNPAGGKAISFGGVVLQNQNLGEGYFLGTSESGKVIFGQQ